MGKIVYIVGDSGTGKSTAIRTLNPDETYIINVCNKDLPFRGSSAKYKPKSEESKGNLYTTNDHTKILRAIDAIGSTRPEIKTLIIDDFGFIITHQVFANAMQKGFDKFTLMAKSIQDIIEKIQEVRSDLYVFLMWHSDLKEDGTYKLKTTGKMIDNQIKPEGHAAIVLHTQIRDGQYKFLTQNDGIHIAKSPMGMFQEKLIDNDLQYVINKMNDYYNEDVPQ